jgi:hypothetical protein
LFACLDVFVDDIHCDEESKENDGIDEASKSQKRELLVGCDERHLQHYDQQNDNQPLIGNDCLVGLFQHLLHINLQIKSII